MADEGTPKCIYILLAIILPPLGVFLKFGCQFKFWICLFLTLFGYLPGIIYAVYAITKPLGAPHHGPDHMPSREVIP